MHHEIGFDMQRLDQVGALAAQAVASGTHPSALVMVANSAETIWTRLVPGGDKLTEQSIFLLASITKPIVGTAIMRLVEEGRLLLHRPVADYLPAFGAHGKERVTAWHLLTHTSGLEETRWWAELAQQQGADHAVYFEAACRSYLHFEPGSRCEYCSLSFAVLGELISLLGGEPYPQYLRSRVFAPLGMHSTAFAPLEPARAAPVHDFGGQDNTERFTAIAAPGGGLWSTAADLVAFGQTMLRGGRRNGYRLLGPAAMEAMTRNHTPGMTELKDGHPQPFNYGLGWGKLDQDGSVLGSERSYGHGGATGTFFWVDPAWDMVFVFLTNRWGVEHETPRRLLNAVYGALELS